MSDVTRILDRVQQGEAQAASELLPLVYEELRQLAAHKMAQQVPGHTLQPTALLHEAWLKLTAGASQSWNDRQHFFRAAAEAMRQLLVDRARQRKASKHGGDLRRTELAESKISCRSSDDELMAVDEALEALAQRDPTSAELVKLRFFAGLSMAEAAQAIGLPLRSAERRWTFAKAWLREAMSGDVN